MKGVSSPLFAAMDGNGRIHAIFNNREACVRYAFRFSTNSLSLTVREVRVIPCDSAPIATRAEG
jgi:hypothetical protein